MSVAHRTTRVQIKVELTITIKTITALPTSCVASAKMKISNSIRYEKRSSTVRSTSVKIVAPEATIKDKVEIKVRQVRKIWRNQLKVGKQ